MNFTKLNIKNSNYHNRKYTNDVNDYSRKNNLRIDRGCDGNNNVKFIEKKSVYNVATYPIVSTIAVPNWGK